MTIKELADIAGVSKGTVSRVLNGQKGVGEKTRKRIENLMKKTGYTPKAAARQLAKRRSGTIGAAMPADFGTSGFYWSGMINALTRAARSKGYILTVSPMEDSGSREDLLTLAQSGRVDGFILFGDLMDGKIANALYDMRFPFSIIGEPATGDYSCISIDNRDGGRLLGSALIQQSAENILLLAGPRYKKSVQERVKGFNEAVAGRGVESLRVVHLEYEEASYRKIHTILDAHHFDGIAVSSGDFVLPVVQKMNCGSGDCHTVFFDDNGILTLLEQSLKNCVVIHQDIQGTAAAAMNSVIELLEQPGGSTETHTIIPLQVRHISAV